MYRLSYFCRLKDNLNRSQNITPNNTKKIELTLFRVLIFTLILAMVNSIILPSIVSARQIENVKKKMSIGNAYLNNNGQMAIQRVEKFSGNHVQGARLWAGTNNAGVWLYENGEWKQRSNGLGNLEVRSIQVDPFEHNRLVAVTPIGVYRTINRGNSWSPVTMPFTQENWNTAYFDRASLGDIVISGPERGEVFKSDPVAAISHDGGVTWIGIDLDFEGESIAQAFPSDVWGFNGTWYILGDSGLNYSDCTRRAIWRSIDYGETWKLFCSFPSRWFTKRHITGLWRNPFHIFGTFDHLVNNPIAESTDGGESWTIGDQYLNTQGQILTDPIQDDVLWLVANQVLFRSASGPSGFQNVMGLGTRLQSVAVDGYEGFIYGAGDDRRMAFSLDGGNTWTRADLPEGEPVTSGTDILCLSADVPALPSFNMEPIVSESDDAGEEPVACSFSVGHPEIHFGECENSQEIVSGFRFQNIPISAPEDIKSAYLEFTAVGPNNSDVQVVFWGEDTDSALTFSDTNKPSDRSLSSESIVWEITGTETWNQGDKIKSPDLSLILREIVGNPNWERGNALSIIVKNGESNGNHRSVYAFEREGSMSSAAKLIINKSSKALSIQNVTPERMIVKEKGVFKTFTITVMDENGKPVEGASISGYDELLSTAYSTFPEGTDYAGRLVYQTEVSNDTPDGIYNITFIAMKQGYSNSAEITRQVWVGDYGRGKIVLSPEELNIFVGDEQELTVALSQANPDRTVTVQVGIDKNWVAEVSPRSVSIRPEDREAKVKVTGLFPGEAIINAYAWEYEETAIPVAVSIDPQYYVNAKQEYIDYFLGQNFYVDVEQIIQQYVNQIKEKVENGTITEIEIEALIRLILVERAAKIAYAEPISTNIKTIAGEMGVASQSFINTLILDLIFSNLSYIIGEVKKLPKIGPLIGDVADPIIDICSKAANKFNEIGWQIYGFSINEMSDLTFKQCIELGYDLDQAILVAFDAEQGLIDQFSLMCGKIFQHELSEGYVEPLIDQIPILKNIFAEIYLKFFEVGFLDLRLPLGDPWYLLRGTSYYIQKSVESASDNKFIEGNVDEAATNVEKIIDEMRLTNSSTFKGIHDKNTIADWIEFGGLVITVLVSVGAVIVSLLALAPSAGLSSFISAVAGLTGVWSFLELLNNFLNAGRLAIYGLAIWQGLEHMHIKTPRNFENVYKTSFDQTGGMSNYREMKKDITDIPLQPFSQILLEPKQPLPVHWADSLSFASNLVAQELIDIKQYMESSNWEEIENRYARLELEIMRLEINQRIVNNILKSAFYCNRDDTSFAQLDSTYFYTRANIPASDISVSTARFAIAWGQLVQPSGTVIDTLSQLLNESISRLDTLGSVFKNTLQQFNIHGFQIPHLVSIIEYKIEDAKVGYSMQCRIKNISDHQVHHVVVSAIKSSNTGVRVVPVSDTLFNSLEPGDEKLVQWQIDYFGSERILVFTLDIHPLDLPGDFHGDRRILTQRIFDISPEAPGNLDNENIYAYPNPFNPDKGPVQLRFKLEREGDVTIKIYDVSNALVTTLISDYAMEAGSEITVRWDGNNDRNQIVANGTYFYIIESNTGERGVGKVAVLR